MTTRVNRRDLMQAIAVGAAAASIAAPASAQTSTGAQPEDYFYRDDWFGEPWRTPETAVLIHGNDESILHSDAYHIAAANADECVTNILAFIKETSRA